MSDVQELRESFLNAFPAAALLLSFLTVFLRRKGI